jgi:hypothetical protein
MLHWIAAHELLARILAMPGGLLLGVLIALAAARGRAATLATVDTPTVAFPVVRTARHEDPRTADTPDDYEPRHAAGMPATLAWSADGDLTLEHGGLALVGAAG